MLTKSEVAFLLFLLVLVPFVIVGCSTVTPDMMKSAENVCAHHGGFRAYVAKNVFSDDAMCSDGTIVTKWPSR